MSSHNDLVILLSITKLQFYPYSCVICVRINKYEFSKYKYNSVEIAKYIVAYGNDNGYFMNMTKTQKLLYIDIQELLEIVFGTFGKRFFILR